jgi:hypothetical protein
MVYGSAPQKIHYGIQEGWDGKASKKEEKNPTFVLRNR